MANYLDYKDIKFPVSKQDYKRIEKKIFALMYIAMKMTYPVHKSRQLFEYCMGLFLINHENKSHYVYIKVFNRFMFINTKHKTKKHICRYCSQCFSSERVLIKHKEICLEINGKQSVKLEIDTIKFKSYFKQIAVPFKIC